MLSTGHMFTPRITQIPYLTYMPNPLDLIGIVAHRRGGKSEGYVVCRLIPNIQRLLQLEEIPIIGKDVYFDYPRFGYFAKTKNQAREIIWNYFSKYLSKFPNAILDAHRMRVVIPRPRFNDHIAVVLKAARDYDSARGERFYEIMADEFQDHPVKARPVLYSALTDLQGVFYFSGTAKGMNNELYKLLRALGDPGSPEEGKAWLFPLSATNILPTEVVRVIRANMTPEAFRREYELDFTIGYGKTFYGSLIEKFISSREHQGNYDPSLPLILGVDIGVGESFAAWLAQVNTQKYFTLLDYYYDYELLGDLREDILADWGRHLDYIALPHDESRRILAVNKPTKQRDIFTQAFPEAKIIKVKKTANKAADIASVKENFHMIHYQNQHLKSTDLNQGITLLGQYGPKTNDDGIIISQEDKSTGAGHCADALRYLFRALAIKNGTIYRNFGTRQGTKPAVVKMPTWSKGLRLPQRPTF